MASLIIIKGIKIETKYITIYLYSLWSLYLS